MSVRPAIRQPRPRHVPQVVASNGPLLLVLAWFLFIASASAWLPAYNGTIASTDRWRLVAVYAVIAAIAGVVVRARTRTRRDAALASLPALGVLALATVAGIVRGLTVDGTGSPLFLYFGVALLASWAALLVSTSLLSRTRWNRLGLALTAIVSIVSAVMAAAQIN